MGKRIRSLKRQIGKKVYKFPKALNYDFYVTNFNGRLKRLKGEAWEATETAKQAKKVRKLIDAQDRIAARERSIPF